MHHSLLQSEAESLSKFKIEFESMKAELSELQSKLMMKDMQIQKLMGENKSLTKIHREKIKGKEEHEVSFQ